MYELFPDLRNCLGGTRAWPRKKLGIADADVTVGAFYGAPSLVGTDFFFFVAASTNRRDWPPGAPRKRQYSLNVSRNRRRNIFEKKKRKKCQHWMVQSGVWLRIWFLLTFKKHLNGLEEKSNRKFFRCFLFLILFVLIAKN